MANIFVAIPHYKKMPEAEVQRIKSELKMDGWEPYLEGGFHPAFDQSIRQLFEQSEHTFRCCTVSKDGNLPRVRSLQCGIWRNEYDTKFRCDYFLTIDDDISFPPGAIDVLIEDDKPIIGGIYSFRSPDPFYRGKVATRFLDDEIIYTDRPFKVRWLNGGFILSKAETLLKMIEVYKDLEIDVIPKPNCDITITWLLWLPMIFQRQQLWEDWAFCQRATGAGFDVWADLRAKIIHWDAENGYALDIPIEGWTSDKELEWLREKSKEMNSVVEVGSWKGRSTHELLMGCKGKVYAVDHFRGDSDTNQFDSIDAEKLFREFMRNVGHFPNLTLLKMDSIEASKIIDCVDMVFIDACHSYKSVKEDLEAWLPKTRKLICGHDFDPKFEGVMRAVQEKLGKVNTVESIWYKEL